MAGYPSSRPKRQPKDIGEAPGKDPIELSLYFKALPILIAYSAECTVGSPP